MMSHYQEVETAGILTARSARKVVVCCARCGKVQHTRPTADRAIIQRSKQVGHAVSSRDNRSCSITFVPCYNLFLLA